MSGFGVIGRFAAQSPARSFAIGIAIAGVVSIAIGQAISRVPTSAFYDPASGGGDDVYLILIAYPSALIGGLIGGWLCWQELMPPPPVTLTRVLIIAGASTISSLAIGALLGTLGVALVWSVTQFADGFQSDLWATLVVLLVWTLATGLWAAPVYAVGFFGAPFAILVLAWTLLWCKISNRTSAMSI